MRRIRTDPTSHGRSDGVDRESNLEEETHSDIQERVASLPLLHDDPSSAASLPSQERKRKEKERLLGWSREETFQTEWQSHRQRKRLSLE